MIVGSGMLANHLASPQALIQNQDTNRTYGDQREPGIPGRDLVDESVGQTAATDHVGHGNVEHVVADQVDQVRNVEDVAPVGSQYGIDGGAETGGHEEDTDQQAGGDDPPL